MGELNTPAAYLFLPVAHTLANLEDVPPFMLKATPLILTDLKRNRALLLPHAPSPARLP